MKTLILVRHAEAAHGEPMQADIDRPLSRRGYRDAQTVSKKFARAGIVPDLILSGSAPRALKTAVIFSQRLGLPPEAVQINRRIYEAERAEMLGLVRAFDDRHETVMLVGHNPGISGLLHHLADSRIHNLPNCSVAVIALPVDSWRDVAFKNGELELTVCPRGEEQHMEGEMHPPLQEGFALWLSQHSRQIEVFCGVFIGFALLLGIVILFLSRADGSGRMPIGSRYRSMEKQELSPFKPSPFK